LSLLATIVILYYSSGKILQCARKDDPTITSTNKLLDMKKAAYVDLEGSGFEIIIGFHKAKNESKMEKLPENIGIVTLMSEE